MSSISSGAMNQSIGVMLIPTTDHRYDETSHITLVYSGELGAPDQPDLTRLQMTVGTLSCIFEPFIAKVTGSEWFGEGAERVPVITLESPVLRRMRQWVDAYNRSEYKTFRPHMTTPTFERNPGRYVYCEKIALWVGDEHRSFDLGSLPSRVRNR